MVATPNDNTPQAATGKRPSVKGCGTGNNQRGNSNAAKHYMCAGKLPKKLMYVEHRINGFRRHLEESVTAIKGEVSIVDAAAINSACKWERHGVLAQHWLRHEAHELSASDRLKFSEAIAKASDQRDKNLRLLGLDAPPPDPWAMVESNIPSDTKDP